MKNYKYSIDPIKTRAIVVEKIKKEQIYKDVQKLKKEYLEKSKLELTKEKQAKGINKKLIKEKLFYECKILDKEREEIAEALKALKPKMQSKTKELIKKHAVYFTGKDNG